MENINERIGSIVIPNGIDQAEKYLKKHLDCLILLNFRFNESINDLYLSEARLFSQVLFSKGLNILKLLEGVSYKSQYVTLNTIIDPLSIAVLVRNIYETTGLFNLIYRSHIGENSKLIYLLWKASGLNYRQKYTVSNSSSETMTKIAEESELLDRIKNQIKENTIYKNFSGNSRKVIDNAFKNKEYQFRITDNHPNFVSWREMIYIMGFNSEYNAHIYSFLSLYAHPSNVSISQFDQLFRNESVEFKGMSGFMVNLASWFLSAFIADFVNLFPNSLAYFEELELEDQIIVDYANRLKRDSTYSINDSYKLITQ